MDWSIICFGTLIKGISSTIVFRVFHWPSKAYRVGILDSFCWRVPSNRRVFRKRIRRKEQLGRERNRGSLIPTYLCCIGAYMASHG
ncbi:hypothetical protein LguiB_011058 [Lonicera macranthoides]